MIPKKSTPIQIDDYPTVADLPEELFNLYQFSKLLVDIQYGVEHDVLLEKIKDEEL